ncbi:MAG: DUF1002 domain-containing protein [Clostridiales bacterium]|nr:DUF1002 domain-containing protein [Clostridiales bacterium]
MMKKKLAAVIMSAICLTAAIPAIPAMADSQKVVTLGADLSEEQKTMILQYFGVYGESNIETLTITNADEREHLGSYIPLEQIGTKTFSCALVSPTTSGGIQVKTANLTYVTSNMIASTLSTSGVVNCEVLAAAPFAVSGTGALTGILMAYETASGETLDETKKETATQELVTTTTISESVGQVEATQIVNETKIQVIEGDVVSTGDIEVIVDTVAEEENVTLSDEDRALLVELLEKIAEQDYEYEEMSETLERVEENLEELKESQGSDASSDSGSTSVDINIEINADSSSSSDSSSDANASSDSSSDADSSSDSTSDADTSSDSSSLSEDSILLNTDDSVLGSDVLFDATDDSALSESESTSDTEAAAETEADITIETEPVQTESLAETDTDIFIETEAAQTEEAATEASDDSIGFDITISDSYSDTASDESETAASSSDSDGSESSSDVSSDIPEAEESGADIEVSYDSEMESETVADDTEADITETEALSITELVLEPNTDSDAAETASIEAGLNCLTVSSQRTDLIAGTGTLTVYNAADGSLVESVELADTAKVISEQITDAEELAELGDWQEGIRFFIYLENPLSPDTSFYVILSDDAFTTADGTATLVTSLDSQISWYFNTLSYGIALDETVDGVAVGDTVTGSLYMDIAEASYAVIDSVIVDGTETLPEENYITFTESINTFELVFGQSGETVIHVSYYDSAETLNLVNEATCEITIK